jgi:hypothetical protein
MNIEVWKGKANMKAERYFLILLIFAGILCVPVLGEVELSPPEDEPMLIGRPNPVLAGIEAVFVAIDAPSADPNKYGSWIHKLDWKLIERLQENNLAVNPSIGGSFWNSSVLRVNLDLLNLQASQQWVFRVQTSLERTVTLPKQQNLHIAVDVWKTEPVMQLVSEENMPAAVTSVVLEQVKAFIHAYLVANPPDKRVSDAKTSDTVSKPVQEELAKSVAKPATAKYKYVSSKNSKVFHLPDCSSAGRIKPENLVSYNSRAEAVNDGKRPCKICKP